MPDRLANIWRPLAMIWLAMKLHFDALKSAVRRHGLIAAVSHDGQIRETAQAKLLNITSAGFIAHENTTVVPALVARARGRVLDLGPGPGNQIHRFDATAIECVYAVDPNASYAEAIAAQLARRNDEQNNNHEGNQDGKIQTKKATKLEYEFIASRFEAFETSDVLRSRGVIEGSMDTVVSIQVLCAVDDARDAARRIWRLLKPGGAFIFWEHVASSDGIMGAAQACLNPAWSGFVGCHMNRDLLADILGAGEWENPGEVQMDDDKASCLPRIWGELRKKG